MPVKIHGKEYLTVAERLDMLNKKTKGDYSIMTELLKCEDGIVIMKATLKIGNNVYTGHASEEIGSSQITTTSYLEVCETSACGRSLAMANLQGGEISSADELINALKQQESKPVAKKPVTKSKPITVDAIKEKFGEDSVEVIDDGLVKYPVTFGKHKGKEWKDVEESYVVWVANNSKVDWQVDEANAELQRRNGKPKRKSGGVSDVAYEMQSKDSGDEGVNLQSEMPM